MDRIILGLSVPRGSAQERVPQYDFACPRRVAWLPVLRVPPERGPHQGCFYLHVTARAEWIPDGEWRRAWWVQEAAWQLEALVWKRGEARPQPGRNVSLLSSAGRRLATVERWGHLAQMAGMGLA